MDGVSAQDEGTWPNRVSMLTQMLLEHVFQNRPIACIEWNEF